MSRHAFATAPRFGLFTDHRARALALYDALHPLVRAALQTRERHCVYTAMEMTRAYGPDQAARRLTAGAPPLTDEERAACKAARAYVDEEARRLERNEPPPPPPPQGDLFGGAA